jgi:phage-related protein
MKYLFYLMFSTTILNAFSGTSLWQRVANRNISIEGERKIIPQITSLVRLDDASFRALQPAIPLSANSQDLIIQLPTPDGTEMSFRVFESSCMEKPLADKYPNIRTYQAVSIENPSVTAKLDYTEFGFHAMVFSEKGIYFIDPYSNINSGYYNCYYKKGYTRANTGFTGCATENQQEETILEQQRITMQDPAATALLADGVRRTYRLALACTVEYSQAVAGPTPTKAAVLSAMVTSMNRINGLYEKDLSIHMNLVANNDTLIFIGSDSYSNNNGGAMLGQNQTVCNARIGSANYDIGHVFSTGGGGVAFLGCVCSTNDKAKGVTGSSNPIGDGFDIDYVAHEMGHQFGANHTFNAGSGACSGNRNSSTAYEPGSGITIMGYAGICDANDILSNSEDFFHRVSIVEIYNHINSTSCEVQTNTGNTPPAVTNYTATFSIPYKTSFELTAAATDAEGHAINYLWEEWDLGPSGNWNAANNTTAPIFRSFKPSASGTRVFPVWDSLINNVIKYKGEVLPETTRDVKFRCTVKDIDPDGYGAVNAPDNNLTVKSVTTSALFRVTSQATATTFTGNTNQTIVWNVAGTTAAPISCANVNIYLSLDSARTFPYLLASNTPNDGTESVLIPNVATNNPSARIKVKGSGNVFFDLNDGWIKINQALVAAFTSNTTSVCEGEAITFTNVSQGNPDSVRWTINGGSPTTSNSLNSVQSTFNSPGNYTISLTAYKAGAANNISSTNIEVKPKPTIIFNPTAPITCAGEPINITAEYIAGATCVWSTGSSNTTITVAPTQATYYAVEVTNNSCSSLDSVLVNVNPVKTTDITSVICAGESVTIGNNVFTESGNFTTVLQTTEGCDSTVNLALTVNPVKTTDIIRVICAGESVTVGNNVFTESGDFTTVLQTTEGCDSTVNLALTVNPVKTTDIIRVICAGESVTVGNNVFTESGDFTTVLQTTEGCDSTVNLALTVNPIKTTSITRVICSGESVTVGNNVFTESGNFTTVLQTTEGCDSTVNLALTVNPVKTTDITRVICAGESVTVGNNVFTESGDFTTVLQTTEGCDSTVNLALTVNPIKTTSITNVICSGESVTVGNDVFTESGNFTTVLQTSEGCDSTVNLALTVNDLPATPTITSSNDTLYSSVIIAGATYEWYKAGVLVVTTNTPFYRFTSNGLYSLKIINNDCESSLSAEVNASLPTSIRTNKSDLQFTVFPNPNNGLFEIRVAALKTGKYVLSLFNVAGQEIMKEEMNVLQGMNVKQFNLNTIEKGMYFISITGNDSVSTQNILVQ